MGSPWGFTAIESTPTPCPWTPVPSPSHIQFCLSLPLYSDLYFPPLSYLFPPFPFSMPRPPSMAKALCVRTVAAQALKLFQEHPIFSEVISDQEAVTAIEKFVGMCQVLPRHSLLVQEPSGCPGYLVCQGIPSLQVYPQFSHPFLGLTPH